MAVSLRITLTENSYSIQNNTSSVTARVYADATNSYNLMGPSGSVTFGGNASGSFTFSHNFSTYTSTLLYERTFTVIHNADGSGTVTASASFVTEVSAGTITASQSLTLTRIPRASIPSTSGSHTMGQTITINTNRQVSTYTHTLTYAFRGRTGTIATNVGASTTWVPSITNLAPLITDATSDVCVITCTTYSGSTVVGTAQTSFPLSVPASVQPSISSIAITDDNGFLENYDAFIQGKSAIRVAVTAAGASGSTIASYDVSMPNLSASSKTSPISLGVPKYPGTYQASISVKDSRGRSVAATRQITVAAYAAPTISADTQVYRVDAETGEASDEGSSVRVDYVIGITNVNSKNLNNATIQIAHKYHTETEWTVDYTFSGGTSSSITGSRTVANIPETGMYDIRLTVLDSLGGTTSMDYRVGTAEPILDFKAGGDGMAFFGISDYAGVKSNRDLWVTQGHQIMLDDGTTRWRFARMLDTGRVYILGSDAGPLDMWPQVHLHSMTVLYNAQYLYGFNNPTTTSTRLLGVNADNQLYFGWPSGGLRGDVRKTIWRGTASVGSTITCTEAHTKYNMLLFHFSFRDVRLLGIRQNANTSGGYIWAGAIEMDGTQQNLFGVRLQSLSTTQMKWQYASCFSIQVSTSIVNNGNALGNLIAVEGII